MVLKIRVYNVGFGDSTLLSWKEGSDEKHVMIDFGNVLSVDDEPYYSNILKDIKEVTKQNLDLVVCTHQHQDHFGGFYSKRSDFKKFEIKKLWMPYIEPSTKNDIEIVNEFVHTLINNKKLKRTITGLTEEGLVAAKEFSKKPAEQNKKWETIKEFVDQENVHYPYRTCNVEEMLPDFKKMEVEVLAPEQYTSIYLKAAAKWIKNFASFVGVSRGISPILISKMHQFTNLASTKKFIDSRLQVDKLDPDFLIKFVESNGNILDYAERIVNNTSLVLRLAYHSSNVRKIPLLFTGDAQFESWHKIFEAYKKGDCHIEARFLKVSHHGSHNGTSNILAKHIFKGAKSRNIAVISTMPGVYGKKNPVPSKKVISILKEYATVRSTEGLEEGVPVIVRY